MTIKKGFTLIELLAVIVILAIIALIATPIIIGLIDSARKEAFKDSVYGIIKSGELQHMNNLKENVNMTVQSSGCSTTGYEVYTYEKGIPQGDKILPTSGQKPKEGSVSISPKGEIALALHNGKWCARKNYNKSEVTLTDDSPSNCVLPDDGDGFKDVQVINDNVIALSCSGEVFEGKYTNIENLSKIEDLPKIKKIYNAFYFLAEDSDLHIIDSVWNDDSERYEEKRITVNNVKDVVLGLDREIAYIILNNGQVMIKGTNDQNLSGTGNSSITYYEEPTIIPNLTNVKKIAASQLGPHSSTTMALLEDGTVKIWGFNIAGAEHDGLLYGEKFANTPKTVPNLTNVVDIVTERQASFAILNDGSVKVWGNGGSFPLGLDNQDTIETPIVHPNLTSIKELKLYSGQGGSSMLAIKNNGDVLFWGDANWSNNWENYNLTPTLLPTSNIVSASLTNSKILLIDNEEKLWVLGDNGYGNLCANCDDSPTLNVLQCIMTVVDPQEVIGCLENITLIDEHKQFENHLSCFRLMSQCLTNPENEGCVECEELVGGDMEEFLQVLSLYDTAGNYIDGGGNDVYVCPFEFKTLQKLPHLDFVRKISFDTAGDNGEDLNVGIQKGRLFAWGSYDAAY